MLTHHTLSLYISSSPYQPLVALLSLFFAGVYRTRTDSLFLSRLVFEQAAAAAALLAKEEAQRILDEMTPAQKIERAKQAERAHLLQTCMELGVEIFDVSSLPSTSFL